MAEGIFFESREEFVLKSTYVLKNGLSHRSNNLSLLKFFASIAVIISHSFALTDSGADWLSRVTRNQITIGMVAVSLFFWASGVMISKSITWTKSAKDFFYKRCIRIFPPLVAVVVLCIIGGG